MALKGYKHTPWSYRKGTTALYRAPAGLKLAFLLGLSLCAFIPHLAAPLCVIFTLALLSFAGRIGPRTLLAGSGPLFAVAVAVFLIQGAELSPPGVNPRGLGNALLFCLRLAAAFASGSLLFAVTTPLEIRKSLSRAETVLHIKKLKLSLAISLMLGFLPKFFEIWEELGLAWKSRGGKKNLSCLTILVPLVIERLMEKTAETALALESRGAV